MFCERMLVPVHPLSIEPRLCLRDLRSGNSEARDNAAKITRCPSSVSAETGTLMAEPANSGPFGSSVAMPVLTAARGDGASFRSKSKDELWLRSHFEFAWRREAHHYQGQCRTASHLVRSVAPRQITFRSGRAAYRAPGLRGPKCLRRSPPIAGSAIFIRPWPMLLVLPLHGRALRPTDRALDPWEMILRMPLNIARDPMRRPAVSSGPTYDRSGQPSVPLRMRGLICEANDQNMVLLTC
jgi:hypothetical protein